MMPGSLPKSALTSAWLCSSPSPLPSSWQSLWGEDELGGCCTVSSLQLGSLGFHRKYSSVAFYAALDILHLFSLFLSFHTIPVKQESAGKMLWTLIHRQHLTLFFDIKRNATLSRVLSSSFSELPQGHVSCIHWSVYREFGASPQREWRMCLNWWRWEENGCLPWLSVEVLFMSPEMKEDSDCFLTVSFHIRLMRLWVERKAAIDQDSTWCRCYSRLLAPRI